MKLIENLKNKKKESEKETQNIIMSLPELDIKIEEYNDLNNKIKAQNKTKKELKKSIFEYFKSKNLEEYKGLKLSQIIIF